jgi:hypothetical protein
MDDGTILSYLQRKIKAKNYRVHGESVNPLL